MSKRKRYDNALDEFIAEAPRPIGPLPVEVIRGLRSRECSYDREERKRKMIEHGDVDPGYFER